ncbi:uncharacterized protein LOC133341999 isoform X2 [Lethenteron reissneri]|uniref:uncharacterized protein LOC133341999 isoform X2 n=1 Tax=Lethenteron reissneri TaxID=7753 RepID=UPI002AB61381|nr:uncharacterized protein LOC133341999 isoform X2 [Lethenteron reissneri]
MKKFGWWSKSRCPFLLPEGSSWNREYPGCEESSAIFLAHFRVLKVCRSSRDDMEEVCSVCKSVMHPGSVQQIWCSHRFHRKCIHGWLKRRWSCPTCQARAPPHGGQGAA